MKTIPMLAAAAALVLLPAPDADASPALNLKGGCATCHQVDRKIVGPTYREIAAKYATRADALAYLSDRVRKGGVGNWGPIPMAPTDAAKLDDKDLRALLAWILQAK